ncbi:MAG: hypothetical protein HYU41_27390 [Candidatus Rokubacteria bacterium]|nr:hypothetical protein [Candidatus Rokubacteria bacterium]
MVRASAVAERAGVPSSSLVCEGFLGQATSTAAGLGLPDLPLARLTGHVDAQSADELERNVVAVTIDGVVDNLTRTPAAIADVAEPGARDIVFTGSLDDVNRVFVDREWSDGLPIVPPTMDRVQAFLAMTDRAPDERLGVLLPDRREATVWNVAVNGVMAGCRPAYLPVLLAIAEALADPGFLIEHSGDTTAAETLVILSGPLVAMLGFNTGVGALRDGFQANTTAGRFCRLYQRNVAGLLPGRTDKGTFGTTWRVVLAEDGDALARLGWPSVAEDAGLSRDESAVTVGRYTTAATIGSAFAADPERLLDYLADGLVKHVGWEFVFAVSWGGSLRPLLILTPILAETLARAGYDKAAVRRALHTRARLPAQRIERYVGEWTNIVPGRPRLIDLVKRGEMPAIYGESDDPERLVPIVARAGDLMIAVAGDPLRTNACTFVSNGMHGYPTMKRVRAPQRART